MNIINAIQRRERGFESIRDYDIALYRLKCYEDDIYHGITPNMNMRDFNPSPPIFACRFCTAPGYKEILALANEDGSIALQNTRFKRINNEPLEGTQAHCNAIFDIAWMPEELKLVTVSGDHTARLWDVSMPQIKQIDYFHAHTRSVKTAVFRHQDKAVFATGARDGIIMIWDIRANHSNQRKPDNCIANAHSIGCASSRKRKTFVQISRAQSITGLAFQDDFTLISCAAGDGLIKVWDLRKNYTVHKKEPVAKHVMNYAGNSTRSGFSSLLMCPARITLYASCMDNVIYAYNISSYNRAPVAEYYGHENRTYYIKSCLSPDGRYLASGSGDDLAYIWHTNKPGVPLVKLSAHTEEVTCIAWCSVGETKIVTCSDDSCHRIWRVGLEHKEANGDVRIDGEAEAILERDMYMKDICRKLETTPTTCRSRAICRETTSCLDGTSFVTPGPSNESDINHCEEQHNSPIGVAMKRSYFKIVGSSSRYTFPLVCASNLIDSPIVKRPRVDNRGARRLFSTSDETGPSSSEDGDSDELSTVTSIHSNDTTKIPFLPTSNLPNFVVDGTAPHLLQISPQKRKKDIDWLTKIREERYKQKVSKDTSEKLCSPNNNVKLARKSTKSHELHKITKVKNSVASLLDFFKASSNQCEKKSDSEDTSIAPSTSISSS